MSSTPLATEAALIAGELAQLLAGAHEARQQADLWDQRLALVTRLRDSARDLHDFATQTSDPRVKQLATFIVECCSTVGQHAARCWQDPMGAARVCFGQRHRFQPDITLQIYYGLFYNKIIILSAVRGNEP